MIRFKKILSGKSTSYSPVEITSFSVADEQYESAIVRLDKSPYKVDELSYTEEYVYGIDTVFLQTFIKGDKSLYYYKDKNGKENFFIKKNSKYEVLLYKNYLKKVEGEKTIIVLNEKYLQQLSEYFKDCPSINSNLRRVRYNTKDLLNIFHYYKTCSNSPVTLEKKRDKISSEFGIIAGLALTKLTFKSESFPYLVNAGYPQTKTPSLGFFYNLVLSRNPRKWSLYNELLYTSYKVNGSYLEYEDEDKNTRTATSLGYSYLKLNNMLRFKFPINKIFIYLNGDFSNGFAISETNYKKKESKFYTTSYVDEDKAVNHSRKYEQALILGLGSQIKNYSFNVRFENGNGMSQYSSLSSITKRIYFLLGYRF